MYRIVKKETLNPSVNLYEIEAPMTAKTAQPGQFVILRSRELSSQVQQNRKMNFSRGFIAENLSWTVIQLILHALDSLLRNIRQILTLGEILAQQSICILICPPLPRVVRQRKVELYTAQPFRHPFMVTELAPTIRRNGFQGVILQRLNRSFRQLLTAPAA